MPPVISPIYLDREAICLQCFMCMRYMKNEEYPSHITLMTFTQFVQNSSVVSMLALYGSTMHVATL